MARIFVTGSADGLGRATAQSLMDDGHQVIVHVRNESRLNAVQDLLAAARRAWWVTCPTSSRPATCPAR